MLKVTSRGVEKLGEDTALSQDDLEEIGSMFDQYSRGIMFPEKEDKWDGLTPVYPEEEEMEADNRVKELVENYDKN
jgi:hypothetical protein